MSKAIEEMLAHNRQFAAEGRAAEYAASKRPAKRLAIVTCMDTRLTLLLPAALGLKDGDAKMIKNAGGMVLDPWGEAMRSLLVAVYELGVEDIMIIAHTDCGVQGMEAGEMQRLMQERGIEDERIGLLKRCGIDLDKWLEGFEDAERAVADSVELVRSHPLLPAGIGVSGYIFDTATAELKSLDSKEVK